MKGNKINGILWLLIAVFLLGILVRGLTGRDYRNLRFWTWNIGSNNTISYNNSGDYTSEKDYSTFTFDAANIDALDLSSVSAEIKCIPAKNSEKIQIQISNNINVRNFYNVGVRDTTLFMEKKSKVFIGLLNIGSINDAKEIIVTIPETLFDSIRVENVSGNIYAENLSARKIEVSTVSGRIEAEDLQGKLNFNTVSGRIDFSTKNLKNNLDAESVSGKIEIKLPPDADFTADYETVSGSVTSDFEKTGKKDGLIKNGDRTYDLRLETVSGSIKVTSL